MKPALSLFPLAPYSEPSTSREAAVAITPHVARLEALVLRCLLAGPMSDAAIQQATGLDGSTQRPRRVALVNRGLVEQDAGYEVLPSGRSAKCWHLTAAGMRAAR